MTSAAAIDPRRSAGEETPVDEPAMRGVLGNFGTGVAVITAHDGRRPVGFTCQSVTSLSLDPPYVAFCPARTSTSWPAMRDAGRICVNILASDQKRISARFAASGTDKFSGVAWVAGDNGAPVLDDVLARVEGSLEDEHDAGDHTIAVCRVTGLHADRRKSPLLFFRGGFGGFGAFT